MRVSGGHGNNTNDPGGNVMITKNQLKAEAKKLREEYKIKPTHAHEIIAKSHGFNSYNHFLESVKCKLNNTQ